jgi:molybdenum-dependent DNA-binding transcriptional regulator ModE
MQGAITLKPGQFEAGSGLEKLLREKTNSFISVENAARHLHMSYRQLYRYLPVLQQHFPIEYVKYSGLKFRQESVQL